MAGGKGSRIRDVASDIPKPMIRIGTKPVLEYGIEALKDQGFTDIIITVSHLGQTIMDYFGDGRDFGVHIQYFIEKQPLGSGGALFRLRDMLTEDFLLLNADVVFHVDLNRFMDYHCRKGGLVTLFAHPNSHPYDSSILVTDENGAVQSWLSKEDARPLWYRNCVNAGLHIINPAALDLAGVAPETAEETTEGKPMRVDLDRQILRQLCGTGKMFCYQSPEYVKDMGTPDRYEAVCRDFFSGKVHARDLRKKQKAIFLDRDGTINQYAGFLRKIEDFELLPGVAEAVKSINESDYLAIVVTNQPVIARGEVTWEQLKEIHNKMETLLGQKGAWLDAIYCCPHHPQKGFRGEIPELKRDCDCRKPKPGMLLRAAEEYHLDLSQSWMIGDQENDVKAGKAAGCRTALIGTEEYGQDITSPTLLDAVKQIFSNRL